MTGEHRLSPLLTPRSIACIGASPREGAAGLGVLRVVRGGKFAGELYPVNPNHQVIDGLACYASLADLPKIPDLVALTVADTRLEAALVGAIKAGVRAAVIFGGANFLEDGEQRLPKRIAAIAAEAGLPICGGNCMGFYNLDHHLKMTFHVPPYETRPGNISLLTQSGSSWSSLSLNDGRLGYNLAVSSGQELSVPIAEYLDYAVEQPNTRVVGLILETVREPARFFKALDKANARQVPVVALKVGRTEQSAALAVSHSGAIAGDDGAYEAIFDHFGVSRVRTLEEMAAAFQLLSQPRPVGSGGLASTHDSGFERELFVDLASDHQVPFAAINETTTAKLAELLDPGLEPVNPLDVWGTGHDYPRIFNETLVALCDDPDTAMALSVHSPRDGAQISDRWVETCLFAAAHSDKPIAMATSFPLTCHQGITERLTSHDIPLIEGMSNALAGIRCAFEQRDFRARTALVTPPPVSADVSRRWRTRLSEPIPLDEAQGLALLADYQIPVVATCVVESVEQALAVFEESEGAVVVKTCMAHIQHKSEHRGVYLNLASADQVEEAYRDLAERLGPRVSISPMVGEGVEMSLGIVVDPTFGPLVMIAAGGTLIELLAQRALALPPLDQANARRLIAALPSKRLLDGYRGREPADIEALCNAAVRLSALALDLGDLIAALDINPLIVNAAGAIAVDALVVTKQGAS